MNCRVNSVSVIGLACSGSKFVPQTKARPAKRDKWISSEISKLLKEKKKLWFNMSRKERRNRDVRVEYNRLCKRTEKSIKRAVLDYERDLASRAKHDPKLV